MTNRPLDPTGAILALLEQLAAAEALMVWDAASCTFKAVESVAINGLQFQLNIEAE